MTVGCVIFTVPRRNRVSHAFNADTPRASPEMAMVIGSAMCLDTLDPSITSGRSVRLCPILCPTPASTHFTSYDAPTANQPQAPEDKTQYHQVNIQRNCSSSPEYWPGPKGAGRGRRFHGSRLIKQPCVPKKRAPSARSCCAGDRNNSANKGQLPKAKGAARQDAPNRKGLCQGPDFRSLPAMS